MARIRTIKPEFFKHEDLYDLEMKTKLPIRVAFAGLWTVADRLGRFRWKSRTLKADILPHDDLDFSSVLDALARAGFIVKYSFEGQFYGYIPSWKDHQFINNKEPESGLPEPVEVLSIEECDALSTREPRVDDALSTRGVKEGKGKESISSNSTTRKTEPDEAEIVRTQVWPYYLSTFDRNEKSYSWTDLRRLKGVSRYRECRQKTRGDPGRAVELMKLAIDRMAESDFHMGRSAKSNGKKYIDWELHLFKSREQMERWWNSEA